MDAWTVVAVALAAAGAVVVWAVLRDVEVTAREVPAPPWDLPTPGQLRELRFPLRWEGYDPDVVDATLAAVIDAYEELYVAAGPAAVARATAAVRARRQRPPTSGEELEDGGGHEARVLHR